MAPTKRTEIIRLTLTEAEKKEMQDAADLAGIPVAVWVRSVALAAARRS